MFLLSSLTSSQIWLSPLVDKAWFTLGVKADSEKNFSICPKLVINAEHYGPVLAPRLKKGYHQIWEANLQPFGPMFHHFLLS